MRSLSAANTGPMKVNASAGRKMTNSLLKIMFGRCSKLSLPGRFEPFELLERFELSNRPSWNRELLENVYGFLWRFKNRGSDISGFVYRPQARRRPLTFLPFAPQ